MKLKYTLFLLVLLIFLPGLLYLGYEITTLENTESMITEIYNQHQNTMLFSVNQYSWDISTNWASNLEKTITPDRLSNSKNIINYMNQVTGLQAVFLSDTLLTSHQLFSKGDSIILSANTILDEIRVRKSKIHQLIYRKRIGYTNIESIVIQPPDSPNRTLVLLSIAQIEQDDFLLIGMLINAQNFISEILGPKLQEVSRGEFDLGIFFREQPEPVYSVGEINDDRGFLKRRIWLFPDHYLGIRKSGISIQDIVKQRFYRNLRLIGLLDIVLLIGSIIVYRNIRRAMELSQMKSDFVSNVSHELRTPLALIRMFVETLELERVKTEEKKKEYYTIIGQETERLTYLINNILDFSKMEVGKKQYNKTKLLVNELVQQTLEMYQYNLQNHGFTLEKTLSTKEIIINADKNAFTEALLNLLDNAVKYSGDSKSISVRTFSENKYGIIEVADSGIGISSDQQKKIFEKFYRVSTGLTHNTKGSGLGLSIVQHIMHAHEGLIRVISQPGKGSTFQLKFPLT